MAELLRFLADSSLIGIVVLVYLGLIVLLACTATFTSKPARRQAALKVLHLLWPRPGDPRK